MDHTEQRDIDAGPPVASVEIDRFCEGCGYNLRTQPVRRDDRTHILIVRCPECGRFAAAADGVTAARPWLHRLATLLLFGWMLFVLWIVVMLCVAQTGLSFATLEELTTWESAAAATTTAPAATTAPAGAIPPMPLINLPPNARIVVQGRSFATSYQRVAREPDEKDNLFVAAMMSISVLVGFLTAVVIVVAMHHWRRWVYFVPVLVIPAGVATIVYISWSTDTPDLLDWARPYILANAVSHLAGGLLGVFLGRAFMRMLVGVLLPPRVRPALSFLWLADSKAPPAGS